jgi:methionyl-tRNA formyltransferase
MKIVFMGTPHAAVPSLERLIADGHEVAAVYTQPNKPAGRGNKLASPPVKDFAVEKGLRVLQPAKIRTAEALEEFRSHHADLVVVVAYGRILPESFLNSFPGGAINVHFSLLPKYRGAAPVNWAIVQGETETGVSTMQMDAGLDTGPILLQRAAAIGADETAPELMIRLAETGAELLSETLGNIDSLTPRPQDEAAATLAPIMKREDGLISWMLDAREINHRVRGFQPFPTAFTFYEGKRLTIWNAGASNAEHRIAEIGTVIKASGGDLHIFCGGDSVLQIGELQLEGKRRMSTRDFLNGVRVPEGHRFGE